jgi:hypothetical protein
MGGWGVKVVGTVVVVDDVGVAEDGMDEAGIGVWLGMVEWWKEGLEVGVGCNGKEL